MTLKELLSQFPRYRANSNKWPGLRVKIGYRDFRMTDAIDGLGAEVSGLKGADARRVFARLDYATGRVTVCDLGRCYNPLSGQDDRARRHLAIFEAIWQNPVGFIDDHGRQHHFCCICGANLTHDLSTVRGYGPECAKKFGLPYGNGSPAAQAAMTL